MTKLHQPSAVTMRDVAEATGLSLGTISLTLNGKAGVSEATRQRVLDAVERMGYVRSPIGAITNRKASGLYGTLLPISTGWLFKRVSSGISLAAEVCDLPVFVHHTQLRPHFEARMLQIFTHLRMNGLLITAVPGDHNARSFERLSDAGWKMVQLERRAKGIRGPFIGSDNHAAARAMTQRLIAKGHRRIGVVHDQDRAGRSLSPADDERRAGYRAAMEAAGLAVDPGWSMTCDPADPEGAAPLAWLKSGQRPDALLWCSNHRVHTLIEFLDATGRVNGRDTDVILFDPDIDWDYAGQVFTCVFQDGLEMGRRGFELLAGVNESVLKDAPAPSWPVDLEVRLPCLTAEYGGLAVRRLET